MGTIVERAKCAACGSGMDAWGCVKCGRTKAVVDDYAPKHRAEDRTEQTPAIYKVCTCNPYFGSSEYASDCPIHKWRPGGGL